MIALPEELEQAAAHIAQLEQQPLDEWIANAVEKAIEDYQDIQIACVAKQKLENGQSVRLSMNDAMRMLDDMVN